MNRYVTGLLLLAASGLLASSPTDGRLGTREERIVSARPEVHAYIEGRRATWGIGDPQKQLRETAARTTRMSVIFRFQQYEQGLRVYGSNLTIAVSKKGGVTESNGLVGPVTVSTTPRVTGAEAMTVALQRLKLARLSDAPKTELLIVPDGRLDQDVPSGDRLAWLVELATSDDATGHLAAAVFVDAHSAEVLSVVDALERVDYGGSWHNFPVRLMFSALNPHQASILWTVDRNWDPVNILVQDPCYGTGVVDARQWGILDCYKSIRPDGRGVANGGGNWVGDANGQLTTNIKVMTFPYATIWAAGGLGDGILGSPKAESVAADVHHAMFGTFIQLDAYFDHLGLDGVTNGPPVRAYVHHPSTPTNFLSNKSGDTIFVARATSEHYDMASFDVIAHEIAHGMNAHGPQLQLVGEPGKLSESTANMFALLMTAGDYGELADVFPFRIGEYTLKNNPTYDRALTYMDAPPLREGTVACYMPSIGNLENHRGAGPGDHMFYLLVYGGSSVCNGMYVQPIGRDAAREIWYDAFMRLTPTSGYSDLRAQFVNAAEAYAGLPSTVLSSTHAAFDAVEIP